MNLQSNVTPVDSKKSLNLRDIIYPLATPSVVAIKIPSVQKIVIVASRFASLICHEKLKVFIPNKLSKILIVCNSGHVASINPGVFYQLI